VAPAAPSDDTRWMRVALCLARRRVGQVAPNPAVGAVVVAAGRALGRGATGRGGRPHAETVALDQARRLYGAEALRGATVYASLEPCNHQGKTPPCTEALIDAGIARVVCSIEDPDPRVSGGGIARLRAAGITVDTGPMAAEARAVNAGFLSRHERGRPWIVLKLATSLDGRIATRSGESRWITGPLARRRVHVMRAEADAVMIGAGTARADDPMLDIREIGTGFAPPVRVVADAGARLDPGSRLVESAQGQPVWVLHGPEADAARCAHLATRGVRLEALALDAAGGLDLGQAAERLSAAGLGRVLVEGGGQLAAGLLARDLVDEIVLFQAGRLIGGDGQAGVGPLGLARLGEAAGFTRVAAEPVGPDLMSIWRRCG